MGRRAPGRGVGGRGTRPYGRVLPSVLNRHPGAWGRRGNTAGAQVGPDALLEGTFSSLHVTGCQDVHSSWDGLLDVTAGMGVVVRHFAIRIGASRTSLLRAPLGTFSSKIVTVLAFLCVSTTSARSVREGGQQDRLWCLATLPSGSGGTWRSPWPAFSAGCLQGHGGHLLVSC